MVKWKKWRLSKNKEEIRIEEVLINVVPVLEDESAEAVIIPTVETKINTDKLFRVIYIVDTLDILLAQW